jgi:hypothetical protein
MNPDSGKIHPVMSDEQRRQFAKRLSGMAGKIQRPPLLLDEDVPEAGLKRGDPLPPDWPQFVVGQELKQVKGWKLVIDGVDTEAQRVIVRWERR